MEKLYRANAFMGKHLLWFVMGCVALGLAFPETFDVLNDCSMPLFAFMTFVSSLGGGFRELAQVVRRPLPVITVLLLLHVILPLMTMASGNLLFPHAPLFTLGLILAYCIPTGVASLMWSNIAGGNVSLCLSIVLLDTLMSPVVIPVTLKLLADSSVKMDTMGMMKSMMIMVAIPALIAMTMYQTSGGRVAQTLKPKLDPFSKITMLLIIIGNSTGCAPFLKTMDKTLVLVMAATVVICLVGFFTGYLGGKLLKQDFPSCQTMCLNTGMRNISAGAVLAMQYFPAEVMFPVAFSPLFLQLVTAIVVKVMHGTKAGKAWLKETSN